MEQNLNSISQEIKEKAVEQKLINYGFKKISSLGDNSIWKN